MNMLGEHHDSMTLRFTCSATRYAATDAQCMKCRSPVREACKTWLRSDQVRKDWYTCESTLRSRLNNVPTIRLHGRTLSLHGGLSHLWAAEALSRSLEHTPTSAIDWINAEVKSVLTGTCVPLANQVAGLDSIAKGTWFNSDGRELLVKKPIMTYQRSIQAHPMAGPLWYRGFSKIGLGALAGPVPDVYGQYRAPDVRRPLDADNPPFCLLSKKERENQVSHRDSCKKIMNIFNCGSNYCAWVGDRDGRCNPVSEPNIALDAALQLVLDSFAADRMVVGHEVVDGMKERFGCKVFLTDISMSSAMKNALPQTLMLDDATPGRATSVSPDVAGDVVKPPLAVDCPTPIRFALPPVVVEDVVADPDDGDDAGGVMGEEEVLEEGEVGERDAPVEVVPDVHFLQVNKIQSKFKIAR